jgi:hypothetical protein
MAQVEPFDMPEKERDVVKEFTTTECGENCVHCEHTEACDPQLHFHTRYCGLCRVHIFCKMQKWYIVQFDRKSTKIEREGTQEFMPMGRVFYQPCGIRIHSRE